MSWIIPAAAAMTAAVLAACSGTAEGAPARPQITGDVCALHPDPVGCRDDAQGCAWYANTRPCRVGEPCPAGWCYLPSGGAPPGGPTVSASCACPAGAAAVCAQVVGPPVQVQPPITCETPAPGCTLPDRCSCLPAKLGACASSAQVANLCVCSG